MCSSFRNQRLNFRSKILYNFLISQQCYTVILVLTEYDHGLKSLVSFDMIRSESLPLRRDDVYSIASARVIRVSLKIAVHFIAELQQREEKTSLESKLYSEQRSENDFASVKTADDYADEILNHLKKDRDKQIAIKYRLENIRKR